MKDWRTWAIVVLAAWCATITAYLANRIMDERAEKRKACLTSYMCMKKYGGKMLHEGKWYTFETARKHGVITDEDMRDAEELDREKSAIKDAE